MSLWRQLVLFGFAATAAYAHTSVIHLPKAASHVEWSLLGGVSSDWEVTVTLDAANCDIYCVIRRRPDSFGRMPAMDLLLPPGVVVRIFSGSATQPITRIIDPAGCTTTGIQCQSRECEGVAWVAGKNAFDLWLSPRLERGQIPDVANLSLPAGAAVTGHFGFRLPLRI